MKTIAIDFDGVIHKYSEGWKDGSIYDEPFDNVFEIISDLMQHNYVFIFSSRSPRQIRNWINSYLLIHDIYFDSIFSVYGYTAEIIPFWTKFWKKRNVLGITRKKLPATIYIDDKVLRFEGNWSKTIEDIKNITSK